MTFESMADTESLCMCLMAGSKLEAFEILFERSPTHSIGRMLPHQISFKRLVCEWQHEKSGADTTAEGAGEVSWSVGFVGYLATPAPRCLPASAGVFGAEACTIKSTSCQLNVARVKAMQ